MKTRIMMKKQRKKKLPRKEKGRGNIGSFNTLP